MFDQDNDLQPAQLEAPAACSEWEVNYTSEGLPAQLLSKLMGPPMHSVDCSSWAVAYKQPKDMLPSCT
jgi:hypothetical protein